MSDNSHLFVNFLAAIVTIGFFITVFSVSRIESTLADHDILNMMVGVLGTVWVQMMNHYFSDMKK